MKFLYSNLQPIKTQSPTFADTFNSLMQNATRMDIAVGYVTMPSIMKLLTNMRSHSFIQTLNLIIGMHYLERFTKEEYDAASSLNKYLRDNRRGEVRLVTPFRFHGKLYSYSNKNGAFAGIIGSDNLGSIVESRMRIYEASVLLDETHAVDMRNFIDNLSHNATQPIDQCNIENFKRNVFLEGVENVEKAEADELVQLQLTNSKFDLPLIKENDTNKKSDLNANFASGRGREWFEVEIIVSKDITELTGYPPAGSSFNVITDDGWKFPCKCTGTNKKNFRSADDLTILGRWAKGRLVDEGVLQFGQAVTPATLEEYGRNTISLTETTTKDLWYLDFGVR